MSDALKTIEEYFQDFRDGIARCEAATMFNRADLLDALNRLNRLRDRYVKEAEENHLTPPERDALSKVFFRDTFIEGLLHGRQIGEHVTKRDGRPVIRTTANAPVELHAETSAISYFCDWRVKGSDVQGRPYAVDHLKDLRAAEKRIDAAIRRARSATT